MWRGHSVLHSNATTTTIATTTRRRKQEAIIASVKYGTITYQNMNNNKSNVGLMHYYMRVVWRLHGGRLILLFDRRWPIVVVVRTNNSSSSRLVVATIVTVSQSRMEIKS